MKKIPVVIIVVVLLATIGYCLFFFVFSGLGTGFAKACSSVKEGMAKSEVMDIMSGYQNKRKVVFTEKDGLLTYITPGLSGDYQCYVYLNDDSKVKSVVSIFD